jgi:hypothetical protein
VCDAVLTTCADDIARDPTFISNLVNRVSDPNIAFIDGICAIVSSTGANGCLDEICTAITTDITCITQLRTAVFSGAPVFTGCIAYNDPNTVAADVITDPGSGDVVTAFTCPAKRNNVSPSASPSLASNIAVFQSNTNTSYTVNVLAVSRGGGGTHSVNIAFLVQNISGIVTTLEYNRHSNRTGGNNSEFSWATSGTQLVLYCGGSGGPYNWSLKLDVVRTI